MARSKKRADAFFGLHFDFHATDVTKGIGTKMDAERFGKYLDEVKPDYVQIDSKGHLGYTSFYSEYGDVAPGLEFDWLKVVREETEKRGILLIAHHSGIWDAVSCKNHPEWAMMRKNGEIEDRMIESTSPYVDVKLIPQLKELVGKYGIDGFWIDGDCWCIQENYRPEFLEKFYKESGFTSVDDDKASPSRIALRDYCQNNFSNYLKHYISEVKKEYPDTEFASNWAASALFPVKAVDEIDFLSADAYIGHMVRTVARAFASQNKPWDIMSWGGTSRNACKHISRFYREAAMTISQGGGYQIDFIMTDKGEIREIGKKYSKWLYDFLSVRKEFNYKSKPVKGTAILYSDYERRFRRDNADAYLGGLVSGDLSVCDIFIDGGRPVDIVYDYQVEDGSFAQHDTIILPEISNMKPEVADKLRQYVKDGGNLLVCGAKCCKLFEDMSDVKIKETSDRIISVEYGDYFFTVGQDFGGYAEKVKQEITVFESENALELGICHDRIADYGVPCVTAAVYNKYGKGNVAFIGWNILSDYENTRNFAQRDFMRMVMDKISPKPAAYLEKGINNVEITPAEKDGRLIVNLINTSELYNDVGRITLGEIPPIYNITVAVKCEVPPKAVFIEPEHIPANYSYDGEYIHVNVEKIDVHTIIAVDSK